MSMGFAIVFRLVACNYCGCCVGADWVGPRCSRAN